MTQIQDLDSLTEVPTFMGFDVDAKLRHLKHRLFSIYSRDGYPYKHLIAEAGRAQQGVGIRKNMKWIRSRLDHSTNAAYFVARVTDNPDAVAYTLVHDVSSLPWVPHSASRLTESYTGMGERDIIVLEAYGKGPFKEVDGESLPTLIEAVGGKRKNVVFHMTHPDSPLSKTCDALETTEGSMVDYLAQKSTPLDGGYLSESVRKKFFDMTEELYPGCPKFPKELAPEKMRKLLNYPVFCYSDRSVGLSEGVTIPIMKRMLMRADENEAKELFDEYGLPITDDGSVYRWTDSGFKQTAKRFGEAYPDERLVLRLLSASQYRTPEEINRELEKSNYRVVLYPGPTIHPGVDATGHGKNPESVKLVNHFLRGTEYPEMVKADMIIKEETKHDGIVVPIMGQSPHMDNIYIGDQPLGDPMTSPQTMCTFAAVLPTRGSSRYVPIEESKRVLDYTLRQIKPINAYLAGLNRRF